MTFKKIGNVAKSKAHVKDTELQGRESGSQQTLNHTSLDPHLAKRRGRLSSSPAKSKMKDLRIQ